MPLKSQAYSLSPSPLSLPSPLHSCDTLNAVRGLHDDAEHGDDDDGHAHDGDTSVKVGRGSGAAGAAHGQPAGTIAEASQARRDSCRVATKTRGGGKAAAEQASRAATEHALRTAALANEQHALTRETGAVDLLAFAADAMVAKGLLSLIAHLDGEVATRCVAKPVPPHTLTLLSVTRDLSHSCYFFF
jgi:hypothetical protein